MFCKPSLQLLQEELRLVRESGQGWTAFEAFSNPAACRPSLELLRNQGEERTLATSSGLAHVKRPSSVQCQREVRCHGLPTPQLPNFPTPPKRASWASWLLAFFGESDLRWRTLHEVGILLRALEELHGLAQRALGSRSAFGHGLALSFRKTVWIHVLRIGPRISRLGRSQFYVTFCWRAHDGLVGEEGPNLLFLRPFKYLIT